MSILPALQSAILRCTGERPNDVFSSTDQVALEFADLSNEVATDIAKAHDWRDLVGIVQFVGDGTTEAFQKPADYDRMLADAAMADAASWLWGYTPIQSVSEWMDLRSGTGPTLSPGGWIILSGNFVFYPAPTGTAETPYMRNAYATDEVGSAKSAFSADTDSFVLSDRLLTLGLIWRWKEWKGLEYAEDMRNYEIALAQEQSRDKGARVIAARRPLSRGVNAAHPYALGPDIP